jgi:hypothetical protein
MKIWQHWRLAAALIPGLLLGTSVSEHFGQLGWNRLAAGVAQFSASFVLGIAILLVLSKLLPTKDSVG